MSIENNTTEMKTSDEIVKSKQFVFYIAFNNTNTNDEVKQVIENIKKFNNETRANIKYNFVKNAVTKLNNVSDEKTCISHIYLKISHNNIDNFKKYQPFFSKSKYYTHTTYENFSDDEKQILLNTRNSFLNITFDEEANMFHIKSNISKNSHYYLFCKIFTNNDLTMNTKHFKYAKRE